MRLSIVLCAALAACAAEDDNVSWVIVVTHEGLAGSWSGTYGSGAGQGGLTLVFVRTSDAEQGGGMTMRMTRDGEAPVDFAVHLDGERFVALPILVSSPVARLLGSLERTPDGGTAMFGSIEYPVIAAPRPPSSFRASYTGPGGALLVSRFELDTHELFLRIDVTR